MPLATWWLIKRNVYIYHPKKTKEAVSNVEITVIKYEQLNETYPASTTHILEKFSKFLYVRFSKVLASWTWFWFPPFYHF